MAGTLGEVEYVEPAVKLVNSVGLLKISKGNSIISFEVDTLLGTQPVSDIQRGQILNARVRRYDIP